MSLAATRELADAVGVEPLALLRANRDRAWCVDSGSLAFASLRPGDVLRHPEGGEIQILLMGASPPDPTSTAANLGLNLSTAGGNPQSQQILNSYLTPDAQAALANDAAQGIKAASSGQAMTSEQIQGAMVAGATTAAILLGATAAIALPLTAIAALVFGGGYLGGEAIKQIFHITNQSPVSCTPTDPDMSDSGPHPYGHAPTDAHWIAYDSWLDSLNVPSDGVNNGSANPSSSMGMWSRWQAYTSGNFEDWARPLIRQFVWYQSHCAVPPPLSSETVSAYYFLQGLAKLWNDNASPGAAKRTISFYQDNPAAASTFAYARDPVQYGLGAGRVAPHGGTAPVGLTQPVSIEVAESSGESAPSSSSFAIPGMPAQATAFQTAHTYVVVQTVPGADLSTGKQASSAEPLMSEAEFLGFVEQIAAFSPLQILWWGPTSTTDDPAGYLATGWLAELYALRAAFHAVAGEVFVLGTYTAAGGNVPADVTAFDVTGSMTPRQTVLAPPAAPGLSTGAKVAIGAGATAAAAGGLWLLLGKPLTIQALQSAFGRLLDRI